MGLPCDGFEGWLSALFENTVARNDEKEAGPTYNLGNKGTRKMNRLACSINYDAHCGNASCGRSKGRVHRDLL